MTFFTHVGPSLLRVIYRSMGDCYTMEDHVSSSFTQLLLPNYMVQAEARSHEPLLSHHRTTMSRTSHEQINTAAVILGLHQPWHAWNRGKYSPLSLWLFFLLPSFHYGPWALEGVVFCLESAFFSILSSCVHPAHSLPAEPAASGVFLPWVTLTTVNIIQPHTRTPAFPPVFLHETLCPYCSGHFIPRLLHCQEQSRSQMGQRQLSWLCFLASF